MGKCRLEWEEESEEGEREKVYDDFGSPEEANEYLIHELGPVARNARLVLSKEDKKARKERFREETKAESARRKGEAI